MEWEPEEQAWHSYINFEMRYKELQRARTIYERYILLCTITCIVYECSSVCHVQLFILPNIYTLLSSLLSLA